MPGEHDQEDMPDFRRLWLGALACVLAARTGPVLAVRFSFGWSCFDRRLDGGGAFVERLDLVRGRVVFFAFLERLLARVLRDRRTEPRRVDGDRLALCDERSGGVDAPAAL
jgi:hypothetical protein